MPKPPTIRKQLLAAGVRNLKEFGYPDATPENILTVRIYACLFDYMLAEHDSPHVAEVKQLRAEISKLQ